MIALASEMVALLYGVTRGGDLTSGLTGVLAAPVKVTSIENGELALLHSLFPHQPELPMPQSAIEFHSVLQAVLRAHEIIPFRFPTWLAEKELQSYLELDAGAYTNALDKIAGSVQMEVHLTPVTASPQPSQRSGREYLQSKAVRQNELRSAVKLVREDLGELGVVREWRLRSMPDGSMRMFALVPRTEAEKFSKSAAPISVRNASLRVTGPWAATEFIELQERGAKT